MVAPKTFDRILRTMEQRIPGIARVEPRTTEDGRLVLRFQDGSFKDPFIARYVSDGTIKFFAYLLLLNDPTPHPLLCVEEPENQLYPTLLVGLMEEFRAYGAHRHEGQVMVSSHSPDLLSSAQLDEVFWLSKEGGYTTVHRARDNEQVRALVAEGDTLGALWKQGFFEGADPGHLARGRTHRSRA